MIAHARAPGRFSMVGSAGQRRIALPAVTARGARSFREHGSPESINREKGDGESLTLPLSICCLFLLPSPRARSSPIFLSSASLSTRHLHKF
jgi:hypothetical protein